MTRQIMQMYPSIEKTPAKELYLIIWSPIAMEPCITDVLVVRNDVMV